MNLSETEQSTQLGAIDLNLLVALDLLLEERSVRAAARRAHISPSAMSHTLARLRRLLDDPLLVRAGRGMVATPRAEALALPVRELLARARTVLTPVRPFDPARLQQRFRIVCTDHVSTVLLGPAEERLAQAAPGVDWVVAPLVPDTMEQLRQGRVDVAIGVFPEAPPEARVRPLFHDRFVTVCRPEHPRWGRRPLDLAGFLTEQHLLVAPRGTPSGLVDRILAEQGRARRVARALPGFLAALWHVSRSDALLTISQRLVDAVAPTLPLTVHPPPLALPDYRIVLAWHPRTQRAPAHIWLRDLLTAVAGSLGPLRSAEPLPAD